MKKALICGVSGQDGGYWAKLLLAKGYHVVESSRDARIVPRKSRETHGWQAKYEMQPVVDEPRRLKGHEA
jgi:GDP-D-mannose dehydratase